MRVHSAQAPFPLRSLEETLVHLELLSARPTREHLPNVVLVRDILFQILRLKSERCQMWCQDVFISYRGLNLHLYRDAWQSSCPFLDYTSVLARFYAEDPLHSTKRKANKTQCFPFLF